MKTYAKAKPRSLSSHAVPLPNALAHQAQLRCALLRAGVQPRLNTGAEEASSAKPPQAQAKAKTSQTRFAPGALSSRYQQTPKEPQNASHFKVLLDWVLGPPEKLPCSLNPLPAGALPQPTNCKTQKEPRALTFVDGDALTEALKKHAHIEKTRENIAQALQTDGQLHGDNDYAHGRALSQFAQDARGWANLSPTTESVVALLGTYALSYEVIPSSVDPEKRTAEVIFYVYNATTLSSAANLPKLRDTEAGARLKKQLEKHTRGPLSPLVQRFYWKETLSF